VKASRCANLGAFPWSKIMEGLTLCVVRWNSLIMALQSSRDPISAQLDKIWYQCMYSDKLSLEESLIVVMSSQLFELHCKSYNMFNWYLVFLFCKLTYHCEFVGVVVHCFLIFEMIILSVLTYEESYYFYILNSLLYLIISI